MGSGGTTERVWTRMKEKARGLGQSDVSLTQLEARAVISRLFMDEDHLKAPTGDVLDFYANEMVAMVEQWRLGTTSRT